MLKIGIDENSKLCAYAISLFYFFIQTAVLFRKNKY